MSSHADTIRLRHFVNNAALLNDSPVTQAEATEALDALLDENQRLRDALQRAHEACCKPEDDALARLKAANIIVCEALAGDADG